MNWMFITWVVVSILLPLSLLGIILWAVNLFPLSDEARTKTRILAGHKDGQLCFVVLPLAASCAYDLLEARDKCHLGGWSILVLVFVALIGFISACIALAGTIFSVPIDDTLTGKAWRQHYRALVASLVLAGVISVIYIVVHNLGSCPVAK